MDQHRVGKCSDCNAQYRVPATFKADKAKCKKCNGVVKIGPVQGEAPSAPAAKPAAKPAPAKKVRPTKAAKASPARTAAPIKESAKGDSVRTATESAAARVREASVEQEGAEQPVRPGKAGARKHRKARVAGKSRDKKKKSNIGIVLGLVAIVLIAGGGGWFLMNKDAGQEAQAAETVAAAETEAETTELPAGEVGDAAGDDGATGAEAPTGEAVFEGAGAETETDGEASSGTEEPAEPEAPPPAPAWEFDLLSLPDQVKLAETSDEEWDEITALVATTVDPAAGARGNRARTALEEKGRVAFPAILNGLKVLDLTTSDGYRNGDLLQQTLEKICNGNNYGWKHTTEDNDVGFNKKVVQLWFQSWAQVVEDSRAWIGLGNLDDNQKEAYLAEIGVESVPGSAQELDDF